MYVKLLIPNTVETQKKEENTGLSQPWNMLITAGINMSLLRGITTLVLFFGCGIKVACPSLYSCSLNALHVYFTTDI